MKYLKYFESVNLGSNNWHCFDYGEIITTLYDICQDLKDDGSYIQIHKSLDDFYGILVGVINIDITLPRSFTFNYIEDYINRCIEYTKSETNKNINYKIQYYNRTDGRNEWRQYRKDIEARTSSWKLILFMN